MKFWVKIIIAVCIVMVIGFAVWAFVFREKDEVQAYNRTAELIDYKQSLGIKDKLVDLRNKDYITQNPEKVIGNTTDSEKSIHNYRELCLSVTPIEHSGDLEFYSYIVMDDYVDQLIEYYLPYTQSNTSKSKPLKKLKGSIEDYRRSLKNMNETLEELIEYQDLIEGSEGEISVLNSLYGSLYSKYRLALSRGADVIISMVEYIDISVYSDNAKLDVTFALNDAYVRSLRESTTIQDIIEPEYANDVKVIKDLIDRYKSGENIFNEKYTEYDFLKSYSILYNNYPDALNFVFASKNQEKQQMADGNNLSNVAEKAHNSMVIVLNVLGF